MKVSIPHVVLFLFVLAFVLVNSLFGGDATVYGPGGPTRIINDPGGRSATVYGPGGPTRIINDPGGRSATVYGPGGPTRIINDPGGRSATVYGPGGPTRIINDPGGGGATVHHPIGGKIWGSNKLQGGSGTMHSFDGVSPTYSIGQSAFGMGSNSSKVQAPSGILRPTSFYSSPEPSAHATRIPAIDMPLSTSQGGPYSRPVIEGYRYIGSDRQSGDCSKSAFAAAAEEAVVRMALEAGLQAAQRHFETCRSSADESSSYESSYRQSRKAHCYFRLFLLFVLIVGVLRMLASRMNKDVARLCKKAFSIPTRVINLVFGRKCEVARDSQGELVSVKMPKSIIIPLVVTYIACALPSVIFLCNTDIDITNGWSTDIWIIGVACLIPMVIPVLLNLGMIFARRVIVVFCMCAIIVVALFAAMLENEVDESDVWMSFVVSVLIFRSLIAMLRLPQSTEWFLLKKEMSSAAIRRMKDGLKAKADKVFGSAVFVFAGKWYVWIAAVLIVICFVVIFRGLFSPLPSNVSDAVKHRMAHGQRERLEQVEKPDVHDPAALP